MGGNGIIYIRTLMKFETINKKVTCKLHSKGGVKETTPKQVVDSDDKIRLSKGEIEFILNLIHDGMIPGKKLMEAVGVVEKLQNTYKKLM